MTDGKAPAESELPKPAPPAEHRRWVWWVLAGAAAVIVLGGGIASRMDMLGDPRTVVQATSDAIVIQPAEIIDVVTLARPRFGLNASRRVFDGIRLDPPVNADTLLEAIGAARRAGDPNLVMLIQRVEITPACQVSFERMVEGWIRIDVRSVQSAPTEDVSQSCLLATEILLGEAGAAPSSRHKHEIVVLPGQPASLVFRPSEPLHFRRFAVSGLGFTTSESGSPESAVRGARVILPDYGDRSDTAYVGDAVTLGSLTGELAELQLDRDGIRSLFKGTASNPAIGSVVLTPSLLQQSIYARDLQVIIAVIVAFASVLMAIFQVVLRS